MRKKLQQWVSKFLVRHLFNWVTDEDFLRIENTDQGKVIYYRGKPVRSETAHKLIEDAKNFQDSVLWKSIRNELKYHAHRVGVEKSTDERGLIFARAALFIVEQVDKKLKKLRGIE